MSDKPKDVSERATPFSKNTIELLSQGFVQSYQPSLSKVKAQLAELTTKQAALLNHMHDENLHLAEIKDSPELLETFGQIKLYHNKLVNIKKDMRTLHEKSAKLKKRALRLQQHVEKETYLKNQQKEMQLKMEQDLIAKMATDI